MKFCVLGSGSKGNATYVESGKTSLLIDGGFSGVEIQRRLASIGVDYTTLDAILVTHEHNDHIKGVPVFSRRGHLHVFANEATFQSAGGGLAKVYSRKEFNTGEPFSFQSLFIHPFSISHDTADPVGFILTDVDSSLGYCTDTGMVSRLMGHRLSSCNGLILESNHDPDILRNGPYPQFLKQRVQSNKGHLANEVSAAFLADLLHGDLTEIVLAHLSETNNLPGKAYHAAVQAVKKAASKMMMPLPRIVVAQQDHPSVVMQLGRKYDLVK